jgi:ribosomal protein L22
MADEKTPDNAADAASSSSGRKPPRAAKAADKAVAAEKPARTRAAAKKADDAPAAKTPRARAAAKPAGEKAAAADKPARTRAAAKPTAPKAEVATKAPRAAAKAAEASAAVEAPKPARRAAARKPAETAPVAVPARTRRARPVGPVTVRAQARYVRSSARKARLVCNHIRGKSVPEARALLGFAPRGVAADWAKLLDSAVANAEHNHELIGDELRVTQVYADEGPTLKRFRTRAMGRATPIHKRTSHLTIMLGSKE